MNLLAGFDRGRLRKDGTVAREVVHCHLWFGSAKEAMAFVDSHRNGLPVPPPDGSKPYKVKWPDFHTVPNPV